MKQGFPMLLLLALLPGIAQAVQIGERAPAIVAPALDGKTLRLADLRGKVVYVDFWASWCGPCRESLPVLDRLHRDLGSQGFRVLTVNVDTETKLAQRMAQQLKLDLPVALDPEGKWAEKYALPGMPTGYLVDRKGVVRSVHGGYKGKDLPELEQSIQKALKGKT